MVENKNASREEVYGENIDKIKRILNIKNTFANVFGITKCEIFSAPGRTEIIGNHTDHNGGKVIAASIDMDTVAAVFPNESSKINIVSEGYEKRIIVNINDLEAARQEKGTTALVAGMVEAVKKFGYEIKGFDACVTSDVISGAGVSSSASFEMVLCAVMDYFFNNNNMSFETYAKIGQYAENAYWNKSSGLMDQMACAVGGTIKLDFSVMEKAGYEKMDFLFEKIGYKLVIVNTGKGHANLSKEYSDVPNEMRNVAKKLGVNRLCETDEQMLLENENVISNDRAFLRALHFFEENKRVDDMEKAVTKNDFAKIINIIGTSGKSSWQWLQNCYVDADYKNQKITKMLALTQLYLNKINGGACRVHGGGFAGVIACVIPEKNVADYVDYIGKFVGRENVYPMNIRKIGTVHLI